MQYWQFWIGLIAVLIMGGGLYAVYALSIKQNAPIGIKAILLVTIVFVLCLLLILGTTGTLRSDTIGPIIGVIVGFILSQFSKEHS